MSASTVAQISLICVFLMSSIYQGSCKLISISLSNRVPTLQNSEIYSALLPFARWGPSSTFQLKDISKEIEFLIVQAHTQYDSILMSYDLVVKPGNHLNGVNVGLILYPLKRSTFYLISPSVFNNADTYLSIHAYFKQVPIPGGCNIEFNVEDAPYLQLTHNSDIINVDAAPPGIYNKKVCDLMTKNVSMDFYHMYFKAHDYSPQHFFNDIKKMMTVQNILKHGTRVSNFVGNGQMRRIFALYPDVGSVYGVIVTDGNYSSAYVPAHTYGCSISSTCPYQSRLKILMYVASSAGVFLCLFGHFLFTGHVILLGFISTSYLGYLSLASVAPEYVFVLSLTLGTCVSLLWMVLWMSKQPTFAILLLNSFCFGSFVAAIVYYSIPDNQIVSGDFYFWWTALLIILICCLPIMCLGPYCIIMTCTVIGSFMIMISIDYAIGSYLRYIVVNTVRRASVKNFHNAVIDPPYQWRDIVTTIIWSSVCVVSAIIQKKIAKHTGPFPAPISCNNVALCSCCHRNNDPESESLLGNSSHPSYNNHFTPSAPFL